MADPRLLPDTEGAASSVVAFMVAGVIFMASVGAILITSRNATQDGAADDPQESAGLNLQARAIASLLLESPGYAQVGSQAQSDWIPNPDDEDTHTRPDDLVRLGLRESGSGHLDFEKFENLRLAPLEANETDGYVNYEEAISTLGLTDSDLDFHIRAYPTLRSVRDILDCADPELCRDPNLRVAYLADIESVSDGEGDPAEGINVGLVTCTVRSDNKAYTLSNTVLNGGTTTVQFVGMYHTELGTGTDYDDRTRSYMLAPGGTATLSIDVPALAGRSCASGSHVELELWDASVQLGDTHQYTLGAGSTATSTVTKDLWVNPSLSYYHSGDAVVLEFGGDLPAKKKDPSVTLGLTVKRASGTVVHGPVTITVTSSVSSVVVPATAFDPAVTQNYVAELTYDSQGYTQYERILVLPAGQSPSNYAPPSGTVTYETTDPVPIEVDFLNRLVRNFCPYYFDSTSETPLATPPASYDDRCASFKEGQPQPGDIFPDQRDVTNNDLPARLIDPTKPSPERCHGNVGGAPRYDWTSVLVVGSNVDHNSMTSGDAKHSVCEWVMGGGTLIVFGSIDQQVNWLQPIFHAAIRSSSGGISVPDASHPVLHTADDLAHHLYDARHRAWRFNGQTSAAQENPTTQLFTNVVVEGGDPVLAVSDPGALGLGSVILTTWLPYDLFNTGAGTSEYEGLRLVNNLLMQGYHDLFLDYGPEIPFGDHNVVPAIRKAEIVHPQFEDPIALDINLYVF